MLNVNTPTSRPTANVYRVLVKYLGTDEQPHTAEILAAALPISSEAHGMGTRTFLRDMVRATFTKRGHVARVQSVKAGRCIDHLPVKTCVDNEEIFYFDSTTRNIGKVRRMHVEHQAQIEARKAETKPKSRRRSGTPVTEQVEVTLSGDTRAQCKSPRHKDFCSCGFGFRKGQKPTTSATTTTVTAPTVEVEVDANVSDLIDALSPAEVKKLLVKLLTK